MKVDSILFIPQYYPPEIGAPQARIHGIAKRLVGEGVKVTVLTAFPNYPEGRVQDAYRGRLHMREQIDGVDVRRVPIYPTKSAGLVKRLSNYFSFVFTSLFAGLFLVRRHQVLILESPPLFLGLSGWLVSFFKRSWFVMNISDLWPESVVRMGVVNNKLALGLARRLESFLYRRAHAVTGQSSGICRGVQSNHPAQNIALIPNGCDCKLFSPENANRSEAEQRGWNDRFVVGYAGLIGLAQGINLYVESADRLRDDDRFAFLVIGDGPELESNRARAEELELDNIVFLGSRPKVQMPELVSSFDCSIIPLKYFIPGALPSKIYETMACRVPVVLAAEGDPKDLVERADSGIIVSYDSVDTIVDALKQLADSEELRERLGNNGREFAKKYHDRDSIAQQMLATLNAVVSRDQTFFAESDVAQGWRV